MEKNVDKTMVGIKAAGRLEQHRCPHCKSSHTHRSQRRTVIDRVMALIDRKVYSCSDCRHRFYRKAQ